MKHLLLLLPPLLHNIVTSTTHTNQHLHLPHHPTSRGSDIFIEDNPKLSDLAGLDSATIYGSATVQRNSPSVPESSLSALKAKAVPVPITIETLMRGLPANVSASASAPAAPAAGNASGGAAAAVAGRK